MNLMDIWCDFYLDILCFMWRRNKFEIYCRLDFFLISLSLFIDVFEVDILLGFKIDYFIIILIFGIKINFRGLGFWKLNSYFLKDFEYINFIKEIINKVLNDYKEDELVDVIFLWDVMKM